MGMTITEKLLAKTAGKEQITSGEFIDAYEFVTGKDVFSAADISLWKTCIWVSVGSPLPE